MGKFLIVGHSKLPQESTAVSVSPILALTLLIDDRHGVILGADCTLVTQMARSIVAELLVGESIRDDIDTTIELIKKRYRGSAASALVAALKDAHNQWLRMVPVSD